MADPTGPVNRKIPNLFDWTSAWTRLALQGQQVAAEAMLRQANGGFILIPDPRVVSRTFAALSQHHLADPARLNALVAEMGRDQAALWQATLQRLTGGAARPIVAPPKGDRRFQDDDWQQDPWFDLIKQSYLLYAERLQELVDAADGLDEQTKARARFFMRLYIDAVAPTNFLPTNPKALRTALESRGGSVLAGMEHLMDDLVRYHGQLLPHQTDERAFTLGGNIVITPGAVIYRNDLMELIQYSPATETVYKRPLLIVPPWINKYYVMDLKPRNSFVKWVVDQGHTVFMISWINPDAHYAEKRFDDYMIEGPLAALEVIERITGEHEVNSIGYCIGGTLLACTLAHLAARGEARFSSATFFTCMLDYSEPGDLGIFLDEEQIEQMEQDMERRGFLEGSYMAQVFNLLRDNELIWGVHVNNYLLGRDPPAFDLLYWNGDSTRIPRATQSWYVRNMYQKNLLVVPNALSLGGTPLDLRRITTPSYFLSTIEDHIAPWRSTYKGPRQFSGPVRFVLGGSGHIAGAMNPPAANKYYYLTHPSPDIPADPEQWRAGTTRTEGSWWPDWANWVATYGGDRVAPRTPGGGVLPVLEPAPGGYVKMRAGN